MADELSHLDERGAARMVDVSGKPETAREATAEALVVMQPATLRLILDGAVPKGDVIATARIAGIMAAKRTSDLIPLCHPIALTRVALEFGLEPEGPAVRVQATAETVGQTGVEMEALTAVQVALLTIYDMCKAADRGMSITDVRLLEKRGGKSGHFIADAPAPTAQA